MVRLYGFLRWAFLFLMATGLAGCASDEANFASLPREPGRSMVTQSGQQPLQCVPYARDHSDVKIYGDAWTWWDQAAGKFSREAQPLLGAVMVLDNYAGPERGHVAVVRKVVSPREIRVDHANWLDDGSIYLNDPVEDVSADNDWSKVRVFNIKTGAWGGNVYPVQGFIGGSGSDSVPDGREAPRTEPDSDIDGLIAASMTPKAAPKPALRPARAQKAAPPPAEDTEAPDQSIPGDDDPLPHPDMVVSANIPQNPQ
jgi:surface antigen